MNIAASIVVWEYPSGNTTAVTITTTAVTITTGCFNFIVLATPVSYGYESICVWHSVWQSMTTLLDLDLNVLKFEREY